MSGYEAGAAGDKRSEGLAFKRYEGLLLQDHLNRSLIACCRLGLVNHAEEVAVGVLQDDEVLARPISPRIAGRPEPDQSLHLCFAIVCIEVEVQPPALACAPFRNSVQ